MKAFFNTLSCYLASRRSSGAKWHDEFPFIEPLSPATPYEIAELERAIPVPLPRSLKGLLETHNGYPSFFQSIDVLSSHQIISNTRSGRGKMLLQMAREVYGPVWDGVNFESAIVFGMSPIEGSLFLFNPYRSHADGEYEVIWFHNEVIERRDTLTDFLELLNHLIAS